MRGFASSRTVMACAVATTTSACNHVDPSGFFSGVTAPTIFSTMGAATAAAAASACAWARDGKMPSAAAHAKIAEILNLFIEGNFQRLQELNVLRGDFKFRRDFGFLFFHDLFVHADVQRFEEAAVLVGDARILRPVAAGQADRRVEFQHDVVACGANACD